MELVLSFMFISYIFFRLLGAYIRCRMAKDNCDTKEKKTKGFSTWDILW